MKRIAFIIVVIGLLIFGCNTSRSTRNVHTKETAIDTLFDGKGNVISINKHSEREEHRETYYYTVFAVLVITTLILFANSKKQ